jgi:hypothetical protein
MTDQDQIRELLEALKALRSLLWTEGYADSTPAMAKADALIAKAEDEDEDEDEE